MTVFIIGTDLDPLVLISCLKSFVNHFGKEIAARECSCMFEEQSAGEKVSEDAMESGNRSKAIQTPDRYSLEIRTLGMDSQCTRPIGKRNVKTSYCIT